jgi:hypothetical protein
MGAALQTLEGHLGGLDTETFLLDRKLVASASHDGVARLRDLAMGAALQTLEGY